MNANYQLTEFSDEENSLPDRFGITLAAAATKHAADLFVMTRDATEKQWAAYSHCQHHVLRQRFLSHDLGDPYAQVRGALGYPQLPIDTAVNRIAANLLMLDKAVAEMSCFVVDMRAFAVGHSEIDHLPRWAQEAVSAPKFIGSAALSAPLSVSAEYAPSETKARQFEPSYALVRLVSESLDSFEGRASARELEDEARRVIRNAVIRLLNSMAGSLQDAGDNPPHPIAVNGELAEPVARALLFRLPVSLKDWPQFQENLGRELTSAAKADLIYGPFWKLTVEQPNDRVAMRIDPKSSVPKVPTDERSKVINLLG